MATVHEEIERKYDGAVDRPLTAAELSHVARLRAGGTEKLDAVYYDTPDLHLLRRGITLRRRTGGHDAGWHLKTPGPAGSRTETRLPLGSGGSRNGDARLLPAELVALTRADARGEQVAPVAHLRTRRDLTLLVDGKGRTLAELARDTVSAELLGASARSDGPPAGRSATTWVETEVELAAGDRALLDEIDARLLQRGLHHSAAGSKLGRALAGRLAAAPARAVPSPAEPSGGGDAPPGSVGAALTACLRAQVAALHELDPAVRMDEPDSVHRMRVTVRRLRSALAAHRRILDRAPADHLDRELRRLGRALGGARDAEVLARRLGEQAAELPPAAHPAAVGAAIRARFEVRYREAHRAVLRVMDGRRYYALLDELERFATRPPLNGRAGRGRSEARRMLRKQRRRTARRLRTALALPPGPRRDRELHRARKAAKRARYAAESVSPLVGGPAGRTVDRMKRIQKPLGAHQDGVMGERALADLAAATPPQDGAAVFGLGVLYARQRRDAPRRVEQAAEAAERLEH
ncbi:CYTH and CHAD domain-containing protein [Kitasatospora sp. NPDC048540]|uniref:CYTH and CHAD domain-containing protein n=1 Tax=Kitasatospora sp. NPDC048540 TaxID=3155634 RepID=UPI0033FEDF8D